MQSEKFSQSHNASLTSWTANLNTDLEIYWSNLSDAYKLNDGW